jgi:UrcA family protein
MIARHNAAFAAIASVCLVSAASAQDRDPVAAHVRYADLNLSTAAGRAELQVRIRGAAEAACPDMAGTLEQKIDSQRCRNEMLKDGATQIARLTAPSDQRVALADRR